MELTTRQLAVLREVINAYIRTGEAVASRHVASSDTVGLSPATIRVVLSELEELGLLTRSHPSAGVLPTDLSLRVFVDRVCSGRRLPSHTRRLLIERISAVRRELVEDIAWVAELIADVTREAGVAVHPLGGQPTLEAVSLVPLTEGRVLGVVVTSDGRVDKRVVMLSGDWSREDLQAVANYVTETLRGRTPAVILEELGAESESEEDSAAGGTSSPYRRWALQVVRQLFDLDSDDPEVLVAGAERLVRSADFAEVERLRSLVALVSDRGRLAREWRRRLENGSARVIIGDESEVTASGNLGMVATLFVHSGSSLGAVGVIGPRRMDYRHIVPIVEFVGERLTRMMEGAGEGDA